MKLSQFLIFLFIFLFQSPLMLTMEERPDQEEIPSLMGYAAESFAGRAIQIYDAEGYDVMYNWMKQKVQQSHLPENLLFGLIYCSMIYLFGRPDIFVKVLIEIYETDPNSAIDLFKEFCFKGQIVMLEDMIDKIAKADERQKTIFSFLKKILKRRTLKEYQNKQLYEYVLSTFLYTNSNLKEKVEELKKEQYKEPLSYIEKLILIIKNKLGKHFFSIAKYYEEPTSDIKEQAEKLFDLFYRYKTLWGIEDKDSFERELKEITTSDLYKILSYLAIKYLVEHGEYIKYFGDFIQYLYPNNVEREKNLTNLYHDMLHTNLELENFIPYTTLVSVNPELQIIWIIRENLINREELFGYLLNDKIDKAVELFDIYYKQWNEIESLLDLTLKNFYIIDSADQVKFLLNLGITLNQFFKLNKIFKFDRQTLLGKIYMYPIINKLTELLKLNDEGQILNILDSWFSVFGIMILNTILQQVAYTEDEEKAKILRNLQEILVKFIESRGLNLRDFARSLNYIGEKLGEISPELAEVKIEYKEKEKE